MAGRLPQARHDLVVHDLSRDPLRHLAEGVARADTPRAVAEAVEVVFTSRPTPPVVAFGADGLAHGFRPGSAWFDMSTNAVNPVRGLRKRLAPQGVEFLDAP